MNNNSTPGELIPVSDFMTTSVVTANENQSVRDVCKLMYNRKVGSVVILTNAKGPETNSDKNNEVVIGIVTERDYVRLIGFSEMFLVDIPISEIMSKPLITIRKFASITEAVSVMHAKNIRSCLY
jgi:CBS domain-containing protein